MFTSVKLKDNKTVKAMVDKLESQASNYYKTVVNYAANEVRNQAILGIQTTPRTGKKYKRGSKIHIASIPGKPPAIDTGRLVNSINYIVDVYTKGYAAEVFASTKYAADLEFGTTKMAARPFMQPALESSKQKILDKARKFKYKR
jgi:HK97 gp10 family phage protein